MAENTLYIERLVSIKGRLEEEKSLLDGPRVTILLASPGAGKTELMKRLAAEYGVHRIRASQFRHKTNFPQNQVLVLDGLDEVAKIDQSAIDQLIIKAEELNPPRVYLASRSFEWEYARTRTVEEVFRATPRIAYLHQLNEDEQRRLYTGYKPDSDFEFFSNNLARLDVAPLLGNPQMLKIFADAFEHNDGIFTTKREVFKRAIEKLGSELNEDIPQSSRFPASHFVSQAEEMFCKILLSGAIGVAATEINADRDFPYHGSLTDVQAGVAAIATGLFSPTEDADHHEPIHRIVAEFGAASYLTSRLDNPADPLSVRRIYSIIAPNSTVRDELRGMLAWMAIEGGPSIERAVIELDPYTIISNGDPSLLSSPSKLLLLKALSELADLNPNFRGADEWREFSADGFFTDEVVLFVQQMLSDGAGSDSVKSLLLELLKGTRAAEKLTDVVSDLLLDPAKGEGQRLLALRVLVDNPKFDRNTVFRKLLVQSEYTSSMLAANLFEKFYPSQMSFIDGLQLLRVIETTCYPGGREVEIDRPSRYFITLLVSVFNYQDTIALLNALSEDLSCDCPRSHLYDCFCRYGRSCLVGKLLDHLFELDEQMPTASQIWCWLKNVRYPRAKASRGSSAVFALQNNDLIRQEIHQLAFGELKDWEDISDLNYALQTGLGHSGLAFKEADYRALIDFAFENDNDLLWSVYIPRHRVNEKGPFEIPLRSHMRAQAMEKRAFLHRWALKHKSVKEQNKQSRTWLSKRSANERKRERRMQKTRSQNQKNFIKNRAQIEAGRHWGWLEFFANGYLRDDYSDFPETGDEHFHIKALCNCFELLSQHIQSLEDIAVEPGTFKIVIVAHAACLAHFRQDGSLSGIDKKILEAVRTEADVHYFGSEHKDKDAFIKEIETQIWSTSENAESFLRRYIEPLLSDPTRQHPPVHWLNEKPQFKEFQHRLAWDWMQKYPMMHLSPMSALFDIVANSDTCDEILQYIDRRIAELEGVEPTEDEKEKWSAARDFWFLRKFLFSDHCDEAMLGWLGESREKLLLINGVIDRFGDTRQKPWVNLSAEKIEVILSTFIDKWPKVFLPNHWGTGDPPEQTAYRCLNDLVLDIRHSKPNSALSVLEALLMDRRFSDFQQPLKAQKAGILKKLALQDFEPPSPRQVVQMLDNQEIASVEDLRALLIELLEEMKSWLRGAETDPVYLFYDRQRDGSYERKDENATTKIVADRLQLRCTSLGLTVGIELHQRDDKRVDLAIRTNVDGRDILLVVEAKGQWHRELFVAAAEQLDKRYAIHPSAAMQGIYLVYWYGPDESVAGIVKHGIETADQLRAKILETMPTDLKSRIDVYVLDFSR